MPDHPAPRPAAGLPPAPAPIAPLPPPPSLGQLYSVARPYLGPILLATFIVLLGSGVGLIAPAVAGQVIDAALLEKSLDRLDRVVLTLIAVFAAMGVLGYFELRLMRNTGARMLHDLRARLFGHLIELAPDFYETRRVGELLSRLGTDLATLQSTLTGQIPDGIQALFSFIGTLIILLVLHTKLTLIALAVVPPVVLIAVWYGSKLEKLSTEVQDRLAETSSVAEEVLAGVRTVQAFDRQEHERGRYGTRIAELLKLQFRNASTFGKFVGLMQFAGFSAFGLVLWYGGRLILAGELTPGALTSFLLYTFAIAGSVGTLGGLYAGYREMQGASARVFDLLATRSSIADSPAAEPLGRPAGRVAFRRVEFRYPSTPDRTALAEIDFEVQPGEMVGLVGPSGAGKSTLFSLLLRFHDPAAGAIEIDGRDLRSLRLTDLRRVIGLVPQEIFLFGGTVAENLRYGRLEATDDEVRRAAELAGADGFIRALTRGYDEVVGERGVKLSAGQRQRIAIARAFLKDPAILLLDEATSALDPESEEVVQKALHALLAGRTTLVIAHRLATARRAHRVLVLEDGRIAGCGTHEELFASNPLYRRYWELQALRDQQPQAVAPEAPTG